MRLRTSDTWRLRRFTYCPASPTGSENLGTGQLRLNASIVDAAGGADWSRTHEEFFELFSRSCIDHYARVVDVASQRAAAIAAFVDCGYAEISLR
jgi:hypothetical protein